MMQFLFDNGAQATIVQHQALWLSPMQAACLHDHLEAAEWLYTHGGQALTTLANIRGATPLHEAAESHNVPMMEWLYNHGAAACVSMVMHQTQRTPMVRLHTTPRTVWCLLLVGSVRLSVQATGSHARFLRYACSTHVASLRATHMLTALDTTPHTPAHLRGEGPRGRL